MASYSEVAYWQHKTSGDVYAVEINHGGEANGGESILTGVCGPLNYREVTAANLEARDFNFDTDDEVIEQMREQDAEYRLLEPPYSGDR